ncbi:MAG TPA: aspartate--ammonia ligase, partial [Bacteroidales bacterium]|nr:aspartate--ammonia ligase [Bacteroidales bacterium]
MKENLLKTEEAISLVKDTFSTLLSKKLKLVKVSSPLAVLDGTGVNDDLNGVEQPVSFGIKGMDGRKAVVVQSLAKWKRIRLRDLGLEPGKGILTDMRALRPDESFSPIHSIYVDQWDWEKHILASDRNMAYLKDTVRKIYEALRITEKLISETYPEIEAALPEEITFLHADELVQRYPGLSPNERESEATKEYGAIFLIGIGGRLSDGSMHDGRAPDYDDWSTVTEDGRAGLNGDIIVWNPVLESAFEISSMGIRVDPVSLIRQLRIRGCMERLNLPFHSSLVRGELPLSIGGGIGQSRLCMYMLRKKHISQVQVSIWPEVEMRDARDELIPIQQLHSS